MRVLVAEFLLMKILIFSKIFVLITDHENVEKLQVNVCFLQ